VATLVKCIAKLAVALLGQLMVRAENETARIHHSLIAQDNDKPGSTEGSYELSSRPLRPIDGSDIL
jgi:hypothetical protein